MSVIAVKRIGLCILSCLLALMFAEAALRLSGWIYLRQRRAALPPETARPQLRVLCAGDSFTFGIGAPDGRSYPDQLQMILWERSPGLRSEILNGGIPGQNSSELADGIGMLLASCRPDVLVVMTGSNDASNLAGSKYYLFVSPWVGRWYRLKACLSSLRVGELVQRGMGKMRRLDWQPPACPVDPVLSSDPEFLRYMEQGDRMLDRGNFDETLAVYRKAAAISPADYRPFLAMGEIYLHQIHDHENAAACLREAAKRAPGVAIIYTNLWTAYYRMNRLAEANENLRKAVLLDEPTRSVFAHIVRYGLPSPQDRRVFDRLVDYNLGRIRDIARRNRVRVIFMNYTRREHWPGEIILQFAGRHREMAVDNVPAFMASLLRPGARESDYFVPDGHCNARGYRIMAENVYAALDQNGFLAPTK